MTKINLRQHHGIVTGANTDNKAVSSETIANGIGFKSEITSENLNAFFQRNDTSIDTLVSLIMETIRTNNTNVEANALIESIKMHGQSTYYNYTSNMTNMQVGDRFSDDLANVYQVTAGKIINGLVCDNAGHQIIFAGKPLTAKLIDIYNYINSLADNNNYTLGYNTFARKMSRSAFQVKKVVGNKSHTQWHTQHIATANAIEVAKHITDAELLQVMRLPIIDNNSRIQVVNQMVHVNYDLRIRDNPMASTYPMYIYKILNVYQPVLSFKISHNAMDFNSNDGYFNQLKNQGNNLIFSRFDDAHHMPINIQKISVINL